MSLGEQISDRHNRENAARVAGILKLTLTATQVNEFALLRSNLNCGASDEAILARVLANSRAIEGYSAALNFYGETVLDLPHFLSVVTPAQA